MGGPQKTLTNTAIVTATEPVLGKQGAKNAALSVEFSLSMGGLWKSLQMADDAARLAQINSIGNTANTAVQAEKIAASTQPVKSLPSNVASEAATMSAKPPKPKPCEQPAKATEPQPSPKPKTPEEPQPTQKTDGIPPNRVPDRTHPTGENGGQPFGNRTKNKANADPEYKRGINRENQSADILAKNKYKVEQNPDVPCQTTNPDFRIEGHLFDNYAPTTSNARSIVDGVNYKAGKQAPRIVLNLADSNVTLHELREALQKYGSRSLQEIIIIDKAEKVIRFFP